MPSTTSAADGYALALEEARRALDVQERAVAQLSTRAGMLLSAAAVVTSFLGSPLLVGATIGPPAWVAIAAFIAVTATVLAIIRGVGRVHRERRVASCRVKPTSTRPRPQPTLPNPMMSVCGEPADSPPLSWPKYILALLGFPVRTPKIWDQWDEPDR